MITRTYDLPNRLGRPAGPTEGRGLRPYNPLWSTPKRRRIVQAVHAHRRELEHGDLKLCDLAGMIGTSVSYLSVVKNSPWGQQQLRKLIMQESSRGGLHST